MKKFVRSKFFVSVMLFALCFCNTTHSGAETVSGSEVVTKEDGIESDGYRVKVEVTEELREKCRENGVDLEEVLDLNDPTVVLDGDDFAEEEPSSAMGDLPDLSQIMATYSTNYLEPSTYKNVTIQDEFCVTGGGVKAMQSFCRGKDGTVYISQQTGGDVTISRYYYSKSFKYWYLDSMVIRGAGHGQTLEEFTFHGKTYLLVSLGHNPVSNGSEIDHWSTQIGYVEYKPNVTYNSTEMNRYTYLNYANTSRKSFGGTKRVDAALSTDGNYIVIWKKNDDNKIEISGYRFSDFIKPFIDKDSAANAGDQILMESDMGKTVSFQTDVDLDCGFSFNNVDDTSLSFPRSFQGIELSNKGSNGVHSIYICGGNENPEKYFPMIIARYNSNGNFKKKYGISHDLSGTWEMEGIHIQGEDLEIGLSPSPGTKSTQYLARIKKEVFA